MDMLLRQVLFFLLESSFSAMAYGFANSSFVGHSLDAKFRTLRVGGFFPLCSLISPKY